MNLEDQKLKPGQIVFFPKETVAGVKYKPATVIEINPVGAVKLEIVRDIKTGKIKREWFDVKKLRRSVETPIAHGSEVKS